MPPPLTSHEPPPPSVDASRRDRRRIWAAFLVVMLVALTLRVAFAAIVVSQHTSATFADIHGDTAGYVRLGERMYDRLDYTAGSGFWRMRGLVRPPGYPAFYAASRLLLAPLGIDLGVDLRPIVWPQIAVSAMQVAATFALARVIIGGLAGPVVAGLLAACSPTSLASATVPMADAPFAACFAIAFVGLVRVVRGRASPAEASLAGAALALAALFKPAAIYWPIVVVATLLVIRQVRNGPPRPTFADARRLVLPTLIVVAAWTSLNYAKEGVATYSVVSARNLRYEVATKVEIAAERGRLPTLAEFVARAQRITRRDELAARVDNAELAPICERLSRDARATFVAHPGWTARVLASNLASAMTDRYKLIQRQLPDGQSRVGYAIRRWVDATDTPAALVAWFGPMLLAPLLYWRDRHRLALLGLCWIGVLYVALPTATVANEGSRLQLAGEPMALTLIAAFLVGVVHVIRRVGLRIASRRASRTMG